MLLMVNKHWQLLKDHDGWKADGADMVLLQVEVMDKHGRRCPLANDLIHFEVEAADDLMKGLAELSRGGESDHLRNFVDVAV